MIDPEDLNTFRQAVADVEPLPPSNRIQLPRPKAQRLLAPRPDKPEDRPRKARQSDALPAHWHNAEPAVRRPPANPEEAALFAALRGVAPLPDRNLAHIEPRRPPPKPRQFQADEQAALHESLHGPIALQDRLEGGDEPQYLRFGVASTVLRDLRRGRWVIQGELDLHGLNRDEARRQMSHFLADCLHQGKRCVRVIHGKGHGSPQKLSVLRQLVRGWLAQRIEVLAYCQAKPQDGGEGALIVLLHAAKKNGAV